MNLFGLQSSYSTITKCSHVPSCDAETALHPYTLTVFMSRWCFCSMQTIKEMLHLWTRQANIYRFIYIWPFWFLENVTTLSLPTSLSKLLLNFRRQIIETNFYHSWTVSHFLVQWNVDVDRFMEQNVGQEAFTRSKKENALKWTCSL